jgi:hypothetical protein
MARKRCGKNTLSVYSENMKTWLIVGGPLILFTGFALHSDLLTFGKQHPGIVHLGGVERGGTFALVHEETYQCDENGANCVLVEENTEFSEVAGLELEEQPIEYRDGASKQYNKTKQPGIPKFTNIVMRRPTNFDWKTLRFEFDEESALNEARREDVE